MFTHMLKYTGAPICQSRKDETILKIHFNAPCAWPFINSLKLRIKNKIEENLRDNYGQISCLQK